MGNGNETGRTYTVGKGKPPVEHRFSSTKQPESNGRPKGSLNLSTHIRNILEGDASKLPKAIAETIKGAVGEERAPLDAMVIVGLLQSLQGDKGWADWLTHNGYGKPMETHKHMGDAENPVAVSGKLEVILVRPKGSPDV